MNSYLISGPDNGKFAYSEGFTRSCDKCGRIDRERSQRETLKNLKYDVSCTYDNELLISERVFEALSHLVDANNFQKAGRYYYVLPKKELVFNSEKRQVKFGEICSKCGQPSHVIGISPAYLCSEVNISGMYATDLHFGDVEDSGRNLTPGVILTEDLLDNIRAIKPSGLEYEPTHC